MAVDCWDVIPCDEGMRNECPHFLAADDFCHLDCLTAACRSPKRRLADDPLVMFARPNLKLPAKRECFSCLNYLENAKPAEPAEPAE